MVCFGGIAFSLSHSEPSALRPKRLRSSAFPVPPRAPHPRHSRPGPSSLAVVMHGRDIIVLGASAGGMHALRRVCAGLPGDLPASLFIVWHTSATSPGIL